MILTNPDSDSDVEVAYDEAAQFMASGCANDASLYEGVDYDIMILMILKVIDVLRFSYWENFGYTRIRDCEGLKMPFRGNVGGALGFRSIKQALRQFCSEGRMFWGGIGGVPFKFWSGPTFKRIAAKWGELLDVDDYDESNLHSKRICILSKVCEHIHESFKIVFQEEEEDELSVEDNNDGRINDLEANNGIDESDVEEVLETLFDQPEGYKGQTLGKSEFVSSAVPLRRRFKGSNTVNLDMKDYGENKRMDNLLLTLKMGRFDKPSVNRAWIDNPFTCLLSIDQKEDMERRFLKEEVKRAGGLRR
ncbi:hypothetical protein Tco_0486591 [Tanacetum coccineum]